MVVHPMANKSPDNNAKEPGKAESAPIRYPSFETVKRKKVEIATEAQSKSSGRIGRNVHRRSKIWKVEIPDEFRKIIEAEQKLKKNDKDRPIVYSKDGRPLHRPKTQEEVDKELAELLWRVNCIGRLQSQWADWEFKAFKNRVVFYDLCIKVAMILLPILIIFLAWDFCCVFYFEIPHLSTLTHPGFVIPFHFFATPCAMYGYMMKILHFEKARLTKYGLLCIIFHPILLITRCVVELVFNGFRDERSLRYEKYLSGVDFKPEDFDPNFDYETLSALDWKMT